MAYPISSREMVLLIMKIPAFPQPSESQIQAAIKSYLELRGAFVIRLNAGRAKSVTGNYMKQPPAGIPDLMCFFPGGYSLFIEVKSAKGKFTKAQGPMHLRLRELGQAVLVARSVEDVHGYLDAQGWLEDKSIYFTWEKFKAKHFGPRHLTSLPPPGLKDYAEAEE